MSLTIFSAKEVCRWVTILSNCLFDWGGLLCYFSLLLSITTDSVHIFNQQSFKNSYSWAIDSLSVVAGSDVIEHKRSVKQTHLVSFLLLITIMVQLREIMVRSLLWRLWWQNQIKVQLIEIRIISIVLFLCWLVSEMNLWNR